MKKALLFIFFLGVGILANATHITNGFAEYTFLGTTATGDLRYKVSFILTRDCAASQVQFDEEILVGVYGSNRSLLQSLALSLTTEKSVTPQVPQGINGLSVCFMQAVYETEIVLPQNNSVYYLVWVRCCRPQLMNIADEIGNTFYVAIPTISTNNSPRLIASTPVIAGTGQTTSFSMGSNDGDGHTLKYKLTKALAGGSANNPVPSPASNLVHPFVTATYRSGFNEKDPFGMSPSFVNIDSTNGQITFSATTQGRYLIAVEIEEWVGSVFIGKNYREQLIIVINFGSRSENKISAASAPSDTVQKRIFINWIHNIQFTVNKFSVERRTDMDTTWKDLNIPVSSSQDFTDTSVNYDTSYWYQVKAFTNSGVFVSNITKSTVHKNTFPTGISGISPLKIKLYPNPSSEIITIDAAEPITGLKVTDIRGGQMNTRLVNNTINISDLPPGIYYLEIQSGGNIYREKIVKVE